MRDRYLEISPWLEKPGRQIPQEAPRLTDSIDADVVVIGAGYTGLSAALALKGGGLDVVVLDQGFAGSGASGRNAGHLTPTIGKDLPTLLRIFGKERAGALVRFADAAVEFAEDLIRRLEIDCDYVAGGNLLAGVHPKHEARLRRAADAASALGAEVRYLSGTALRERGVPDAFTSAVLEERGGILDPGRYVLGLRDAVLRAGVRLYENTTASELREGPRVCVRTSAGSVSATAAVIATNAYTEGLGRRRGFVAPVRVSLFETEPIEPALLEALGWPGREGVYTAHEMLESYRLTQRGTIVGGSKTIRYRYGRRLAAGFDPQVFSFIESAFRERFPVLRDVAVANFWGGWIGMTVDFLPQIGTEGIDDNIHFGVGFNGHGVAQATLMGQLLADRILGRPSGHEAALRRRHWPWPPEPIQWLGARAVIGALSMLDRRTDRQVRLGNT